MRKTFLLSIAVGVIGLSALFLPHNALAAQVTFKTVPNPVAGDGATIVEVWINPQQKNLNVVQGTISFQGAIADKLSAVVETGGSVLTLWPEAPNFLVSSASIPFTGGVQGGFDQDSLLFRVRLFSPVSGNITISWSGAAYLNDGKGTQVTVSAQPITLSLIAQNPATVATSSPDTTPPRFGTVEIGRDANTYGGKYFISFQATDDISGVAGYEITEGNTVTDTTKGVYVFLDQSRKTPVTITAYDNAGNSATIKIPPKSEWVRNAILIALLVLVLCGALLYGYKKRIKK